MAITLGVIEEVLLKPVRRAGGCQLRSLTGQNIVPWGKWRCIGMNACVTPVCRMDILAKVRGEAWGLCLHVSWPHLWTLGYMVPSIGFLSIFMAESSLSRSQVKNWFLSVAPPEHAYLINISLYLCSSCELVYCFRLSYWTPRPWFCFSTICSGLRGPVARTK